MAIFPGERGPSGCPSNPPIPPLPEEDGFLWAGCPSCHPTISVRTWKVTQRTNPNQWPGLSFLPPIGLLHERVLLPLSLMLTVVHSTTPTTAFV